MNETVANKSARRAHKQTGGPENHPKRLVGFDKVEDATNPRLSPVDVRVRTYVEKVCRKGGSDFCWASDREIADSCGHKTAEVISRSIRRLIRLKILNQVTIGNSIRMLYMAGEQNKAVCDLQHRLLTSLGEVDHRSLETNPSLHRANDSNI